MDSRKPLNHTYYSAASNLKYIKWNTSYNLSSHIACLQGNKVLIQEQGRLRPWQFLSGLWKDGNLVNKSVCYQFGYGKSGLKCSQYS